jgi:hypothetical protein
MERARKGEIAIDVLEVQGISAYHAGRFRQAVERELAWLVRENGLPAASLVARSNVSVDLNPSGRDFTPGSDAHARAVASAIYQGLGQ